jgi:hypothetical protein
VIDTLSATCSDGGGGGDSRDENALLEAAVVEGRRLLARNAIVKKMPM